MSFDSSRFTFNPWFDFGNPVMQQGRVQLDSDWNEWVEEARRRMRAGSLDTFGRAVYPATTPDGFKIVPSSSGAPFAIGVGRMYVDGLLVENHGLTAPATPGWVPGNPANPGGSGATWDDALDQLFLNAPVDYNKQPYYPNLPALPTGSGPYLIYLDVWEREVTFLEFPDLVEKAVGVDTTGRMQTVWQVKWLDVSTVDGGNVSCSTSNTDLNWPPTPSGGRLTTGVVQTSPAGVCCLTPNTGYTGMENQLYRVEIQTAGGFGAATFKWSRNDASVATAVTAINTNVLTVQSTGKDSVLAFQKNDWVEITDDWLELNGQPGELYQVTQVENTNQTLTLSSPVGGSFNPSDPTRHTRAICWNGANVAVPALGTPATLENGVTVSFDLDPTLGPFNSGDFWTFAARTADGTVESLVKAPARGIHHHYARLSVLTLPLSTTNPPPDCRTPWPPDGGGCDCASCVTADSHNDGSWTIQNAIDAVRAKGGGKVCLGPGTYNISSTITLETDASGNAPENLTISGHGLPVLLPAGVTGSIMLIQNATDIVVEGIAFVGGSGTAGTDNKKLPSATLLGLVISDSFFVEVYDCAFGVASDTVPLATGIAYAGAVIYSTIRDNFFSNVAIGIGLTSRSDDNSFVVAYFPKGYLLSQIEIAGNKMYCNAGAVFLSQTDFSINEIRFANNFVQSTSGFVLSADTIQIDATVEENTFVITPAVPGANLPYDAAVASSCSQTRVANNEIFGNISALTATAGTGGTIGPGIYVWVVTALDSANRETLVTSFASLTFAAGQDTNSANLSWGAVAYAVSYNVYRTQANQAVFLLVTNVAASSSPSYSDKASDSSIGQNKAIPLMQNDGIVLGLPPSSTVVMYGSQVTGNRITGLTGSGIYMLPGTIMTETIIAQNQLLALGGNGIASAGVTVDTDIANNTVAFAGLIPIANISGIGLLITLNANLRENRIEALGPAAVAVTVAGIEILIGVGAGIAKNYVVDIAPATASKSVGVFVNAPVASTNLDIVDNEIRRASALPQNLQQPAWLALAAHGNTVNVRGNLLESFGAVSGDGITVGKTLIQSSTAYINALDSCLFSDNQCFQDDTDSASPTVVQIVAKTIIAMGNRVKGPNVHSDTRFSLSLRDGTAEKAAWLTAVGNITTAGIGVPDIPLPAPWAPLNIKA